MQTIRHLLIPLFFGNCTPPLKRGFLILKKMKEDLKQKLIEEYKEYKYSEAFIECCFEVFLETKPSTVKQFIKNHFLNYDYAGYSLIKKCSAHWNNIAYTKLNAYDYSNYMRSLITCGKYRMVAKEMDKYLNQNIF